MALSRPNTHSAAENPVGGGWPPWTPPPPAFPVARCPAGDDAHLCSSLEDALQRTLTLPDVDRVFVIGGAEVYRQCLARTGHGSAPPPCVPCVGWAASL